MENQFDLPEPSATARAHSRAVGRLIRERIAAANGWIDFSEYMRLALYAPGLGYYSAGSRKFGAEGDFVTAPEISSLFSRCLARSLVGMLRTQPSGTVLEIGAGTGAMAADFLGVLENEGLLPERYLILEVSADLRARQAETITRRVPALADRVAWLDALPEQPFDGVILANEVLDALPVTCFVTDSERLGAAGVTSTDSGFRWSLAPAPETLIEAVHAIETALPEPLPVGYASEWCGQLPAFIRSLGEALNTGVIIFIDYGLPRRERYHRDRRAGTLMCHYRHRAHADPFRYPGLQDISAWVDFTAVAEAGVAAGLEVCGYTTQAHYLLAAGIDAELEILRDRDAVANPLRTEMRLAGELKALTLPGQMGERFKLMGLCRGIEARPSGFAGRDLRHLL